MSADDGPGNREVAHRVFAAEFDDATYSYSEGDEERAPTYVIIPSGGKVNRMFFVGVLTEVEDVNEDMLRARIVDPTGAFVVYAGQYQPDARTFFERADPPAFVAVTGKARTFQPDDSDRVFTSVRPESVNEVDADTRDRWIVGTAEATLDRVATMARALRGDVDPAEMSGPALAFAEYDTAGAYLEGLADLALDAARVVAGDHDEVEPLSVALDRAGEADLDRLAGLGGDATAPAPAHPEDHESTTGSAAGTGSTTATAEAAAATTDADGSAGTADASGDAEGATAAADVGGSTGDPETTGETAPGEFDDEGGDRGEFEDDEDLGDFDAGGEGADARNTPAADAADTNGESEVSGQPDEMYELDEEERREVEEEYGTEFSTGTEVDPAGEADIDAPTPDETGAKAGADPESAAETEVESGSGDEAWAEAGDEAGVEAGDQAEPADDADLDEVLLETMRDLDDGGGADRGELVEAVVEASGASEGEVEDAIQDALMGGQCYEPGEDTLKPI